jgi:hypothetical protein
MLRGDYYRNCELIANKQVQDLESGYDTQYLKEALVNLGPRTAFNRFNLLIKLDAKALRVLKEAAYRALAIRRLNLAHNILTGRIIPVKYANANQELKVRRIKQGTRAGISAVKPLLNGTIPDLMASASEAMNHWVVKLKELDESSLPFIEFLERKEYYQGLYDTVIGTIIAKGISIKADDNHWQILSNLTAAEVNNLSQQSASASDTVRRSLELIVQSTTSSPDFARIETSKAQAAEAKLRTLILQTEEAKEKVKTANKNLVIKRLTQIYAKRTGNTRLAETQLNLQAEVSMLIADKNYLEDLQWLGNSTDTSLRNTRYDLDAEWLNDDLTLSAKSILLESDPALQKELISKYALAKADFTASIPNYDPDNLVNICNFRPILNTDKISDAKLSATQDALSQAFRNTDLSAPPSEAILALAKKSFQSWNDLKQVALSAKYQPISKESGLNTIWDCLNRETNSGKIKFEGWKSYRTKISKSLGLPDPALATLSQESIHDLLTKIALKRNLRLYLIS